MTEEDGLHPLLPLLQPTRTLELIVLQPHLKCHEELACIVPLEHLVFIRACSFGKRTFTNHPSHKGQKKRKRCGL
jgi:hypothetical protein